MLNKLWHRIVNFHSDRMIGLAFQDTTKEDWNNELNARFDDAKKLSDFIGMIIRIGFCYLWFDLLLMAAFAHMGIKSSAFFICALLVLCLFLAMAWKLFAIISVYLLRHTASSKSKIFKGAVYFSSLSLTLAIGTGVIAIARAVSKASTLILK
jgi:hypothetical protein